MRATTPLISIPKESKWKKCLKEVEIYFNKLEVYFEDIKKGEQKNDGCCLII